MFDLWILLIVSRTSLGAEVAPTRSRCINTGAVIHSENVSPSPHQLVIELLFPSICNCRPDELTTVLNHQVTLLVSSLGDCTPAVYLALAC